MSFSKRRSRFLSVSPYFCVSCGCQLQEGERVFVFEKCWQRVVKFDNRFGLEQVLAGSVEQFLLCKSCEEKS